VEVFQTKVSARLASFRPFLGRQRTPSGLTLILPRFNEPFVRLC
jgi:hypothetical protein